MKNKILSLRNINKRYEGEPILVDFSMDLYSGEFLSIIGSNGVGKTTIAQIIAGIIGVDSGEIYFDGKNATNWSSFRTMNAGVTLVSQYTNLCDELSVAENLWLGNKWIGNTILEKLGFIKWFKMYENAEEILKKYGYQDIDVYQKVKNLSLSNKRIIALVKALENKARVLILDEPFTFIDETEKGKLLAIIKRLQTENVAVLFISHDVDVLIEVSDRVLVLDNGKIQKEITGGNNGTINQVIEELSSKRGKRNYPKVDFRKEKAFLKVEGLKYQNLIQSINFSAYSGEILGIIGSRNSGVDLILKLIFGILPKDEGEIYRNNKKVTITNTTDAIHHGIIYIPDDADNNALFPNSFIDKNITISRLQRLENEHLRFVINPWFEKSVTKKIIKNMNFENTNQKSKVKYFSAGNKQKVLLSRGIFAESQVICLEEPTKNLDTSSKLEVYNIFNELARAGVSIVMVTSDISEIEGMCDRVLIVEDGKIVKEISHEQINRKKLVECISGVKRSKSSDETV